MSYPLQEIRDKCVQYQNARNVCDEELHAILDFILSRVPTETTPSSPRPRPDELVGSFERAVGAYVRAAAREGGMADEPEKMKAARDALLDWMDPRRFAIPCGECGGRYGHYLGCSGGDMAAGRQPWGIGRPLAIAIYRAWASDIKHDAVPFEELADCTKDAFCRAAEAARQILLPLHNDPKSSE